MVSLDLCQSTLIQATVKKRPKSIFMEHAEVYGRRLLAEEEKE